VSFDFTFEYAHGILRSQFSGNLNDQSLMDYYAAVKVQAANVKPNFTLLEFKDITSVDLSTTAISFLAGSVPAFPESAKPRVIVAPTDLIYGKCRAFEMLRNDQRRNLHIVRTVAEAYSLLGVVDPIFQPIPKLAS
jgi:hypothetical protein